MSAVSIKSENTSIFVSKNYDENKSCYVHSSGSFDDNNLFLCLLATPADDEAPCWTAVDVLGRLDVSIGWVSADVLGRLEVAIGASSMSLRLSRSMTQ